jgi:hypothetical protein
MSDVYDTFGTLLKRGDGGTPTETFATIGGVGDIDGPSEEVRVEEYLAHDFASPTVRRLPTVKDNGVISFPLYWDPSDSVHVLLRTDKDNMTVRNFQLVEPFTGGETASFAAIVSKLGKAYPVEGLMTAEVELSIDGAVTWA